MILCGFDFGIGISFENVQSVGKIPVVKDVLMIWVKGWVMTLAQSLST